MLQKFNQFVQKSVFLLNCDAGQHGASEKTNPVLGGS